MLTRIAFALDHLCIAGAALCIASCAGILEEPERFASGGANSGGGASFDGCTIADFDMESRLGDDSEPGGCAQANCHAQGGPFFDFASPNLIDRLQAPATGSCAGDDLLVPGDPQGSVLYLKLSGMNCGTRMPLTGDLWTAEELACAAEWISNL